MSYDILLKEFILQLEEDWGYGVSRYKYVARLTRDPSRVDDVNEWQTQFSNGIVGRNSSSGEASARGRFAKEVLRLRAMARKAKESGHFAVGRFTVGSLVDDDEREWTPIIWQSRTFKGG